MQTDEKQPEISSAGTAGCATASQLNKVIDAQAPLMMTPKGEQLATHTGDFVNWQTDKK